MKITQAQRAYIQAPATLRAEKPPLKEARADKNTVSAPPAAQERPSGAARPVKSFVDNEMALQNFEAAEEQGEALARYAAETAKYMETARRISRGDKVPPADERKLLAYNYKLYMMAKNMAALHADKDGKKHDSLWKEEDGAPQAEETAPQAEGDTARAAEMPAEGTEASSSPE